MTGSKAGGQPDAQDWLGIAADCWWLGAESAMVIPLRLTRLALGGKGACTEARLMVSEKVEAHGKLVRALAGGEMGPGAKAIAGGVVTHYLGYVRGNRRRLMGLAKAGKGSRPV
ncbi:MAG: hypothetical protein KDE49_14985 [Novosphingobium sp.]|nr:hypothetical protein [Novosphingobium sp.]